MTFFYREMPELIRGGHLYLAQPPLFRITHGQQNYYARDEAEKNKLVDKFTKMRGKLEIGRFKGLGEMTAPQLKETTMNPASRSLLRAMIVEGEIDSTKQRVEDLMGKRPETRFAFIQEQTALKGEDILDGLDV